MLLNYWLLIIYIKIELKLKLKTLKILNKPKE